MLTFVIRNLNHQNKLFNNGLRPVYRVGNNSKWKRVTAKTSWVVSFPTIQY